MTNTDLFYAVIRLLFTLSTLLVVTMVICQQIENSHWSVRMFDFPAKQVLIIHTLLTIIFFSSSILFDHQLSIWVILIAVVPTLALLILVMPYTPISPTEVKSASDDKESDVSIFMANVYMRNKKYGLLMELIEKYDPDCILLTETDLAWAEVIEDLKTKYPYSIQYPLPNTYGMIFYSRMRFKNPQVRFVLKDDIPSIRLELEIKPGVFAWFYGVHPEPPSPTESETSLPRDIELLKLAKEVKKLEDPVLFMGDFNDVAWSHTTRLFRRFSGMLDPRIGRGSFDTFHVKYPLFRWPLDHCFVSGHFELHDMSVLPDIGSDHFPVLIRLSLSNEVQEQSTASLEDKLEVEEKLALEPHQ